jgi:predicted GIY-YIG superfamily endonuclease
MYKNENEDYVCRMEKHFPFYLDHRYFNMKIYKLTHPDYTGDEILYIGQTLRSLHARLMAHRRSRTNKMTNFFKTYNKNRLNIELIESYPCYNKYQASYREQYSIDILKPLLNCPNNPPWQWGYYPRPDYVVLEKLFNDTFDNIYYDDIPKLILPFYNN